MKNLVKTTNLTHKGKVLMKSLSINKERKQRVQNMKTNEPFETIDLRMKKVFQTIEEIKKMIKK